MLCCAVLCYPVLRLAVLCCAVQGKDAIKFLEGLVTGDIAGLADGTGSLSVFTNEKGGIIDDTVITKVYLAYAQAVATTLRLLVYVRVCGLCACESSRSLPSPVDITSHVLALLPIAWLLTACLPLLPASPAGHRQGDLPCCERRLQGEGLGTHWAALAGSKGVRPCKPIGARLI